VKGVTRLLLIATTTLHNEDCKGEQSAVPGMTTVELELSVILFQNPLFRNAKNESVKDDSVPGTMQKGEEKIIKLRSR
jgi:hypothetical protein